MEDLAVRTPYPDSKRFAKGTHADSFVGIQCTNGDRGQGKCRHFHLLSRVSGRPRNTFPYFVFFILHLKVQYILCTVHTVYVLYIQYMYIQYSVVGQHCNFYHANSPTGPAILSKYTEQNDYICLLLFLYIYSTCQISPSQAPLTGHLAYTSPRQFATINNETSWVALLGLLTERLSSMQRST